MRSAGRFLINLIAVLWPPNRLYALKRSLYGATGFCLGEQVFINSEVKVFGNGKIRLGHHVWLGIGAEFSVPEPACVTIGNHCDIGPRVRFICGSHRVGEPERRAGAGLTDDTRVGNGVWIGAGVMLLPGVHLGDGSVVAAGSVVLPGRYPPNALLAGNPAQIKKYYE